jgi:pimeloyl-ACP methyl ester carboxylesterase
MLLESCFAERIVKMAFYDADDAAIYYEFTGRGKPVILLHGYALNSTMWEFQIPVIAEKYKAIAIDLRGFGQSSCSSRWSSDVMAEDTVGMIEELDLTNCAIVGFSMSGPVAFKTALKNPGRISKLIFVSSILPSSGRPRPKKESKVERLELDELVLHGPKAWAEMMGLRNGPLIANTFKRNPESRPVWEKMLSRHNPDFLRCMMEARQERGNSENWREKLSQVRQPTLIIAGAQDDRFLDASRYMARKIPETRLEIISGAGHMVNLESPEEFNRILMGFLGAY